MIDERRFWRRVDMSGECWTWTGKIHQATGYGVVYVTASGGANEREMRAHRVSWALANGEVPAGLSVLHHCDNPPCVRPGHLFLGTHADNMTDMARKGRGANAAVRNPPTHCPSGHPYAEHGVRTGQAQKLSCRLCVNARARAYQANLRAALQGSPDDR